MKQDTVREKLAGSMSKGNVLTFYKHSTIIKDIFNMQIGKCRKEILTLLVFRFWSTCSSNFLSVQLSWDVATENRDTANELTMKIQFFSITKYPKHKNIKK